MPPSWTCRSGFSAAIAPCWTTSAARPIGWRARSIAWWCWASAVRTWAPRALLEACCHPYHNELSREARKGRPRIYFEGNNVDNDAVAGLLDVLAGDDRWAIVVISKSGGTLETAVGFRIFLDGLEEVVRRR